MYIFKIIIILYYNHFRITQFLNVKLVSLVKHMMVRHMMVRQIINLKANVLKPKNFLKVLHGIVKD